MIEVTKYRHQTIGVYGLGKTGCAAIYALLAGGANVIAWDDDPIKRKKWQNNLDPTHLIYSVKKVLVNPESKKWLNIEQLVLTPGIPIDFPKSHPIVELARSIDCPIVSDIELLQQTYRTAKYIGITGTNGKSTSTSLIAHIANEIGLRCQMGGNIGISALELDPLNSDGFYILELSSYQIDLFQNMHFNIAILLNITPDHLDYHNNLENYIKVKARIFENQQRNDLSIISIDCPNCLEIYRNLLKVGKATIIPISTKEIIRGGISVIDYKIYDFTDINSSEAQLIGSIDNFKHLPGLHNQENIAVSYAAFSNYQKDKVIKAINSFVALPHRSEYVGKYKNITFINDSKGTNAKSTEKALLSFDNIFWIVGGLAKEGGIQKLEPYFNRIKHAFLIGDSQENFAEFLNGKLDFTKCFTLEEAFNLAVKKASLEKDHIHILLSPACASWDQWNNFEERGNAFIKLAKEYMKN